MGVVFSHLCTPTFDQFRRPLQHLKVEVQASVQHLTKVDLKKVTAAVDETLWVTIRSLLGHESAEGANTVIIRSLLRHGSAEGANTACQKSVGISIRINHLLYLVDIRVTRKTGDGGWKRSSVASSAGAYYCISHICPVPGHECTLSQMRHNTEMYRHMPPLYQRTGGCTAPISPPNYVLLEFRIAPPQMIRSNLREIRWLHSQRLPPDSPQRQWFSSRECCSGGVPRKNNDGALPRRPVAATPPLTDA